MKMVQMDFLNFSDNFSYIIYFIWSYGWISMIFRSLYYFLEFSDISKIEIIQEIPEKKSKLQKIIEIQP